MLSKFNHETILIFLFGIIISLVFSDDILMQFKVIILSAFIYGLFYSIKVNFFRNGNSHGI